MFREIEGIPQKVVGEKQKGDTRPCYRELRVTKDLDFSGLHLVAIETLEQGMKYS